MYKMREKIVAAMLASIMLLANIATIGIYGSVYAADEDLENQSTQTNHANVEFDTYFLNGEQQTHELVANMAQSNNIYAKVTVKEAGYLKNAKITFQNAEEGEANFSIGELTEENSSVQTIENNEVTLNQIAKGKEATIALPISFTQEENISLEKWNMQNKAMLTGTYVDGDGNEKQIKKEIRFNLGWTAEKQANITQNVTKYVPYHINEESGVILQTTIQANIKDNVLPVQETKIEINVPKLAGINPTQVIVAANSTNATNGEETAESFSQENYTYDEQNQLLTIHVKNEATEEGTISWKKNATDEYLVSYIYPEEVLNAVAETGTTVELSAKADITVYAQTNETVTAQTQTQVELKDQIGEVVSFEIKTDMDTMSKAYLYANTEIPYTETIEANIGLASLTDKMIITQNPDAFLLEGNSYSTTVEGVGYVYNKAVKVSQSQFEKILGQEGKIEIYAGQTLLASIDKQMQADEQGNYVVDLSEYNLSAITIQTSKPVIEGKLEITLDKEVKADIPYTDAQINSFAQYQISNIVQSYSGDTKFVEQTVSKEITLTEPQTTAELVLNNTNLSTVVTNQNVELKAILKTDSTDTKLFKNPTITIKLPSYIEKIDVREVKLLFDDELQITGANLVNNSDGTKSIIITTSGTQTKYSIGAVSGGANIIITADITVNKLTPNTQSSITMEYTNENVITRARSASAEVKQTETPITFVAPTGVVTTNSISNYAEGAETLTSISGEEQTGVIETVAPARNVNYEMSIINNYSNEIDNVVVLGRLPFTGNTNVGGTTNYGTTFDMALQGAIEVSGIDSSNFTIYYSENGNASKDVNLASNGWTQTPSNYATVKSYLIVLNNHSMQTGESFNISYTAQIPANLNHNESAYSNYMVYFNNHLEAGTVEDKQEAAKIGVTTGVGAVLEAQMTSNIAQSEKILEGNIIKYTLTVNNTGSHTAENVVATVEFPTALSYVIEDANSSLGYQYTGETTATLNLGNIAGGQSVTREIWAKVEKISVSDFCTDESHYLTDDLGNTYHSTEYTHADSEYIANISMTASISADNLAKPITSTAVSNTIAKAYFSTIVTGKTTDMAYMKPGATYQYQLDVKSTDTQSSRENTIVRVTLPAELNYESIHVEEYSREQRQYIDRTEECQVDFNESTRVLTVHMGSVDGYYGKTLQINTKVNTLPEGTYEREVQIAGSIVADNTNEETLTTLTETISQMGMRVTQSSNIPENTKIATNEDFKYIFTVENLSSLPIDEITLTDVLPAEVQYVNGTISYSDGTSRNFSTKNSDGNPEVSFSLDANMTATIEINVLASIVEADTTVRNRATLTQEELGSIETNTLTHIIAEYTGQTDEEIQNQPKRISGQVWIDANKNGMKEEDETLVSNVQVMLLNNATGSLVTDSNGSAIIRTTDEKGSYTFENIARGTYTVIFLYDSANYSATSYRVEDATEETNSDAVDSNITLDGETRVAAITEAVNVTNNNIYNIDLGLVVSPKFDLRLDKTISKVTVQDSTGTQEYDYGDSKLAKRDLVGKRIDSTTLLIEYKITVTNEGAVDGYVRKIADYIPAGLSFNAELNRDWYQAENGTILNSSLANEKIAAGESKEVTLLLTMRTSENNLGLISNQAEIYEAYNDLGLEDVDSTVANKASNEDDMSNADLVVTVKTGEYILFGGLTLLVIAIIGVGAYFIKKKVLR